MRAFALAEYLFLATILAASCGGQTPAVRLVISPVTIGEDGGVKFRAIATDDQPPNITADIGESASFHIYSSSGIGVYDDAFRKFNYDLFAKKATSPPRWIHFVLEAVSSGHFLDHIHTLNFTISEGDLIEHGQIRLPLHSLSSDQFLEATVGGGTLDVRLGSTLPIPLQLTNKLTDLGVVVQFVELVYDRPDYWATPGASLTPNLTISDQVPKSLPGFSVRASAAKIVPTIFLPLKSEETTGLSVKIRYASQAGGNPKELVLAIKARFIPSTVHLFLSILFGALLGTAARLIEPKRRTSLLGWAGAFAAAILGGMILELVGIVLTSLNSEFKLFGLKLDPFQLPQVVVMAVLVGVFGVNIADLIRQVIDKGNPKRG